MVLYSKEKKCVNGTLSLISKMVFFYYEIALATITIFLAFCQILKWKSENKMELKADINMHRNCSTKPQENTVQSLNFCLCIFLSGVSNQSHM